MPQIRPTLAAVAMTLGLAAALPAAATPGDATVVATATPTTATTATPATARSAAQTPVTEAEVLRAQQAWGRALVDISTAYERSGRDGARQVAERVIDTAYGYQLGPVLFKPTLASAPQTFRTTRDGALAYFVGGNPSYPQDSGFALKGWRQVEVRNAAVFISGDSATTMGNVMLTDKDGKVTTVDKTWQFVKDADGQLRIVTHHSSLPYAAP